jgi:hypothetical protein
MSWCRLRRTARIRLRCVTQPDPARAALLDRLGIVQPKRMRLAEHTSTALAHTAHPGHPHQKCQIGRTFS